MSKKTAKFNSSSRSNQISESGWISKSTSSADFLDRLQTEAALQAALTQTRFLPDWLDSPARFVGSHTVLALLLISLLTSIFVEGLWR